MLEFSCETNLLHRRPARAWSLSSRLTSASGPELGHVLLVHLGVWQCRGLVSVPYLPYIILVLLALVAYPDDP